MIPFAVSKRHNQDDITLLCDKHHKEATNGLLTKEQISRADDEPYNIQKGVSSPYNLHFEGAECEVSIGNNKFKGGHRVDGGYRMIAISIDDTDLLAFQFDGNGNLFLHAAIFDELNKLCLKIQYNQIAYRTDASWDIAFQGKTLIVKEAAREIFFEIEFKPPNAISIPRGRLLCNGVEILIRKDYVFVVNCGHVISNITSKDYTIGLQIGLNFRQLIPAFSLENAGPRKLLPKTEVKRRERKALRQRKKRSS